MKRKLIYSAAAIFSMFILAGLLFFLINKDDIQLEKILTFCPKDLKDECGTYNFADGQQEEYFTATLLGSIYERNETIQLYGGCTNSQAHPVASAGRVTIRYPNRTAIVNNTIMSNISKGLFNYTRRAPPNINANYFVTFNCTNGSLWATDFGEFQVPTFTNKINELFEQRNEFNGRVKVLERVFANGEFQVEATFYNKSGRRQAPSQIILTIFYENDTVYNTARLIDFALGNDGVYSYERAVGATPRFEVYAFHMTASWSGINITLPTQQSRISSGGPFSIRLRCPATAPIGEQLTCNVDISDEGDAPIESVCTTFVDSNNNLLADGNEPQTSTSQLTQPGQILILNHDIDIPTSLVPGDYTMRVICDYLASQHPDSTASDSITIVSGPSGIGGGTSGRAVTVINIGEILSNFLLVDKICMPGFGNALCLALIWWLLIIAVILGFIWYKWTDVMNNVAKSLWKIFSFAFRIIAKLFAASWRIAGAGGVIGVIIIIGLVVWFLVWVGVAR